MSDENLRDCLQPKQTGLTAACAAAAVKGIRAGGGEAEEIRLNDLKIDKCHACGDGWGTCLPEHRCKEEDDFQGLHLRQAQVDGYVLVTPVYWGELSESAKAFTDRLRRCEATRERGESWLFDKPVIAVVAAGGYGQSSLYRKCSDTESSLFSGANPTSRVHAVLAAPMFMEVLCSRLRGTLMQ